MRQDSGQSWFFCINGCRVKKYRIIVAEDEKHTRRALLLILGKAGYRVTTIENGKKALQKILDNNEPFKKYDLLITDVQMPELSGVELIQELEKQNINIPVLIITGYDDKREYVHDVEKICVECIEKPFEPQDLLELVNYILQRYSDLQVSEKAI